jgi:hypothetical protein
VTSCHGPLLPPGYCKEWQDFFSSRPDVVKENSYCSSPQTLGKKLQPSTQIKGGKKRKKSNAFTLLQRRPMTTLRIVAKSGTKKFFQDQVPSKTIHTASDLKP